MHDKHSKCSTCHGVECSFETRSECQSWSDDIMNKYIKHRKPLDSKSRKSKKSEKSEKDESRFRSSSGDSNVTPLGSVGSHSQGGGLSESRVLEMISTSMSHLSDSLAASMEASFINMESLIDSRISQHFRQDVTNAFFQLPLLYRSAIPLDREDYSLGSPRTEYGNSEGQPEEPVQRESAIPSFLSWLHSAGIALPPGIELVARNTSSRPEDTAVPRGRDALPAGVQTGDSVSTGSHTSTVTRGVDPTWIDGSVNVGASSSARSCDVPPARMVSFSESVDHAEDDNVSEKPPPQEGLATFLRLLYQLCPPAASVALVRPQRSCDFEGLYVPESSSRVEASAPVLFHRIVELWSQLQPCSQSVAEVGKPPSAALPSRKRLVASCAEERLRGPVPFNPDLPRMVGILSSRRSMNFSFDEAAKVESLLQGIMESQSLAFWLLSSLLHWLKELDFVPPDAALFAQLIQSLLLALVSASSSSTSLAIYLQAKRSEGVLSHFPSHVGIYFHKDLAASSFEGPLLFAEDVLARVIASSREHSHLDTQLSVAKAFKLPIFLAAGNSDRKASPNQCSNASTSSSSSSKGRGGSSLGSRELKRRSPLSPAKGSASKSQRRSASPGKGKRNFRK